jgi:hypothetical protein
MRLAPGSGMARLASSLTLLLASCAVGVDAPTDGVALTAASAAGAPAVPLGTFLLAERADPRELKSLELRADGRFLRVRCVAGRCLPEDGHYRSLRGADGGPLLRFYATDGEWPGPVPLPAAALLDTYAWRASADALLVRKVGGGALSSRLAQTADPTLCPLTGGSWLEGQCACGPARLYLAGEGGCQPAPTPSESLCDDTRGQWTDDDVNLLGTYCECGKDRLWNDGVGCVDFWSG